MIYFIHHIENHIVNTATTVKKTQAENPIKTRLAENPGKSTLFTNTLKY
jgi:hypothetical protein